MNLMTQNSSAILQQVHFQLKPYYPNQGMFSYLCNIYMQLEIFLGLDSKASAYRIQSEFLSVRFTCVSLLLRNPPTSYKTL